MSNLAIQGNGFDGTMSTHHDGATGCFITTACFHTNIAILDQIQTSDTVVATNLIQIGQDFGRSHCLVIDGDNVTGEVRQFNIGGLIGGRFGANTPAPHLFLGFGPWIFQDATFIGNMQQVGIHRIGRFFARLVEIDRDIMFGAIVHQRFTRRQIPFTPRRNHLHTGLQGIGTQLKANLIVTLAGGTMRDSIRTGFIGDFD